MRSALWLVPCFILVTLALCMDAGLLNFIYRKRGFRSLVVAASMTLVQNVCKLVAAGGGLLLFASRSFPSLRLRRGERRSQILDCRQAGRRIRTSVETSVDDVQLRFVSSETSSLARSILGRRTNLPLSLLLACISRRPLGKRINESLPVVRSQCVTNDGCPISARFWQMWDSTAVHRSLSTSNRSGSPWPSTPCTVGG